MGVTIAEKAWRWAESRPEGPAIFDGGVWFSYETLVSEAESLAVSLCELGLRPGDVVSFQLPNWREAAVINLAACMNGLVCNPIVPIYRDAELVASLADCRSKAWFVPGEWRKFDYAAMAEKVAGRLPDLKAVIRVRDQRRSDLGYQDLVQAGAGRTLRGAAARSDSVKLVMYTSGTTGRPKGVMHSHQSLPASVNRAVDKWGLELGDSMLMPSPVTHVTGYCCGLEMPFERGVQSLLMEFWGAKEAVRLIDEHGVSATAGATPFLQELLAEAGARGSELSSLKIFACGGAAVPPQLIRRANSELAGRAFRIYGATEVPLVTFGTTQTASPEVGATTDGEINDYDVCIRDVVHGTVLSPGAEGEILVRGDGVFLGYADSVQTVLAFTEDGYFCTGDIGVRGVDDDTLTITGRKKDLIIRGGENISAKEIEDVLHQFPDIVEAAAIAMPHRRLGETVCVFIIAKPGTTLHLEEICRRIIDAGLARQKCPERLELVEELPRTPSGKVRKERLRQMISEKLEGAQSET